MHTGMKSFQVYTPCWYHCEIYSIELEVQLLKFYTLLMLHIFLFGVIKVYLKVKIAFVGFLFLFLKNCNGFENGELHFRPLPFTILVTVCLKEKKP